MNERIEELVETVISQNESEWPDYREVMTGAGALYLYVFAETFAELIVQECAEISENYASRGAMPWSIACAIKEHFGVK
jgi:hypothetical protein